MGVEAQPILHSPGLAPGSGLDLSGKKALFSNLHKDAMGLLSASLDHWLVSLLSLCGFYLFLLMEVSTLKASTESMWGFGALPGLKHFYPSALSCLRPVIAPSPNRVVLILHSPS